jgi:hypothetical protein
MKHCALSCARDSRVCHHGDTEFSASRDDCKAHQQISHRTASPGISSDDTTVLCLLRIRPRTNLDFYRGHLWRSLVGPAHRSSTNLRQPNVLELSLPDKALQHLEGILERVRRVVASALVEIERLGATELLEDIIDTAAEVLRGAIWLEGVELVSAFDREEDLIRIGRVFLKKPSNKLEIGRRLSLAIEFACVTKIT